MEFGLFEKGEKDIILFFNDGLPEGVQCLAQAVGVKELVFNAGKLVVDSELELMGFAAGTNSKLKDWRCGC